MKKVFLTRELPPKAMEKLRAHVDLEMNIEDRVLRKDEIIEGVKGKDGLLCLLTDGIDGEVMDANPNLKIIANYAVGFNNIDVEAATKRGIPVTNTPGVLTDTTADTAFSLILAGARRVVEADSFARTGRWMGWGPLQYLGKDVWGATLGIIGLGRIGKEVVHRSKGFKMKTVYWNRTRLSAEEEKELGVEYMSLENVLRTADFISIHVAYNSETHHLINARSFELMKEDAYLINTARGPIVDEKALVYALEQGQLAGAGLDVFEQEPFIEPALRKMKQVVLLPHLGSATIETRTKMGLIAVENLLAGLRGERPPNQVNEV